MTTARSRNARASSARLPGCGGVFIVRCLRRDPRSCGVSIAPSLAKDQAREPLRPCCTSGNLTPGPSFDLPMSSIRSRLLLLVLAVWLPAIAGFGLLALSTYEREAGSARDRVQQLAQGLSLVVERELDKRAVL